MSDDRRRAFEHDRDLLVAGEEELLLLHPGTLDLVASGPAMLEALGDPDRFHSEISPTQLEIVSPPCVSAGDVRLRLAEGRSAARDAGAGAVRLAGTGAHPFARPWSEIGEEPRYAALLDDFQMGIRLGALAAGLHVHVGVSGADRALAVHTRLRSLMPLLVALSANAPFVGGVDSGLATVRCALADALPRHGTGPAYQTWGDLEAALDWGTETGAVADTSTWWWDCRLNVRTGTVEVRAPDAQASLDDVEAIVALVHAAAARAAELFDAGERTAAHEVVAIQENRWRAARRGLDGRLVDLDAGCMRPTRELLAEILDDLAAVAAPLGADRGLELARRMLHRDTPGALRRIAAAEGLPGLCRHLADRTEDV